MSLYVSCLKIAYCLELCFRFCFITHHLEIFYHSLDIPCTASCQNMPSKTEQNIEIATKQALWNYKVNFAKWNKFTFQCTISVVTYVLTCKLLTIIHDQRMARGKGVLNYSRDAEVLSSRANESNATLSVFRCI